MFKHIDMGAAMQRVAERKIEEAIRAGKFDRLEGAGLPLELEPMPADENARLMWWAIRLLRQNDVIPDEIKLRKAIAVTTAAARAATNEATVRQRLAEANAMIRQLNTLGTNAIAGNVSPLDVELEAARWRDRQRA
jgi:hypothetical protein